jgi:N-acetylmuramoyl-L-alanine amidase
MLSVHADSFPKDRSVRGFNVYVAQGGSVRSFRAGGLIADNLRGAGRKVHGERALRRARYYVLLRTTCPAVLLEAGFLSNRADARLLNDRDQQDRIAQAVAAAILEYLQED